MIMTEWLCSVGLTFTHSDRRRQRWELKSEMKSKTSQHLLDAQSRKKDRGKPNQTRPLETERNEM